MGIKLKCQTNSKKKHYFQAIIRLEDVVFRQVGLQGFQIDIEKVKEIQNFEDENAGSDLNKQVDNFYQSQEKPTQFLDMRFDWQELQFRGQIIKGSPSMIQDDNNMTVMNVFYNNDTTIKMKVGDILNQTKATDNTILEEAANPEKLLLNNEQEIIDPNKQDVQKANGFGIRTMRLVQEKLVDIEDIKREEEAIIEELEEDENGWQQGGQDLEEGGEDRNEGSSIFKRRDLFLQYIQESQFLHVKSIRNLKIYSLSVVAILSLLCIVNHLVIDSELSQSQNRYKIIQQSNIQIASTQNILSYLLELQAVNKGILQFSDDASKKTYISKSQAGIKSSLAQIDDIQKKIQLNSLSLLSKHKQLYTDNVVSMRLRNDNGYDTVKYDLNEATQQVISKVNTIISQPVSKYQVQGNDDYDFLQFNLVNDYYRKSRDSSNYYTEELNDWVDNKKNIFNNFFIIGSVFIIVCYCFIVPFYIFVNNAQKEVLIMFLDIPLNKVKELFQKCETFVTQMQSGNEEDIQSDASLVINQEEEEMLMRQMGAKRKKSKISLKNKKNFFIPLTLACMILATYYVLAFIFSKSISDRFSVFDQNVVTFQNSSIDLMYQLLSQIQKQHSDNIDDHDKVYNDAFNKVLMNNTSCEILAERKNVSIGDCEKFMDKSIKEGLNLALPRHIENFRETITEYEKIKTDPANSNITPEQLYAKTQVLLNSKSAKEIQEMQIDYVQNLFRYLVEQFMTSIKEIKSQTNATRITLLIISIILMVMVYLLVWIPVLSSINREVIRIRSMICMIPLDVCLQTRSIRSLIQSFMTQKYVQET